MKGKVGREERKTSQVIGYEIVDPDLKYAFKHKI
jgi:hypothetical protein